MTNQLTIHNGGLAYRDRTGQMQPCNSPAAQQLFAALTTIAHSTEANTAAIQAVIPQLYEATLVAERITEAQGKRFDAALASQQQTIAWQQRQIDRLSTAPQRSNSRLHVYHHDPVAVMFLGFLGVCLLMLPIAIIADSAHRQPSITIGR